MGRRHVGKKGSQRTPVSSGLNCTTVISCEALTLCLSFTHSHTDGCQLCSTSQAMGSIWTPASCWRINVDRNIILPYSILLHGHTLRQEASGLHLFAAASLYYFCHSASICLHFMSVFQTLDLSGCFISLYLFSIIFVHLASFSMPCIWPYL